MKRNLGLGLLLALVFLNMSNLTQALERNSNRMMSFYNNVAAGSTAGSLIGFSSGLITYKEQHYNDSDIILTRTIYGFLGGAMVGAGFGIYELTSPVTNNLMLPNRVAAGTLTGMIVGSLIGILDYLESDDEDFNAEIGYGGLIGAGLGLGFAAIELSFFGENNDSPVLTGEIGLKPNAAGLPSLIPEIKSEPMLIACQVVRLNF